MRGVRLTACVALTMATTTPSLATEADELPFRPAPGKVLHVHQTTTRAVASAGTETRTETTTAEGELIFAAPAREGSSLRWINGKLTVSTTPERQALMQRTLAAFEGKTIVFRLDAEGAPVGIDNLPEVRALLLHSFETLSQAIDADFAARPEAQRLALRKAFDGIVAIYRTMPDAQLTETLLDEPRLLFGFAGLPTTPGTAIPFSTKVTLPVTGGPLKLNGQIAVQDRTADTVTLRVTTRSDPADIKAAVSGYLAKVAAALDPADRDAITARIRKLEGFSASDELTLTLGRDDGLPRSARYVKRSGAEGQMQVETRVYSFD